MTILDKIVAHKKIEVAARKEIVSISALQARPLFDKEPVSAKAWIGSPNKSGIIAEFKRQSPSKGLINGTSRVSDVAEGYFKAGVSAMSVLTDQEFFGGTVDDLLAARSVSPVPIIRKDFIVDEYQIIEAKSIGADFILLIASCLTPAESKQYAEVARNLGMQILLEVHNQEELEAHVCDQMDLIGVNNRNLKTFDVSIENSKKLADLIPNEFVKVSESGISNIENIKELKKYGYKGFLIGENFMKTDNPSKAAKEFISQL
ncbi:indole-3-glycerol phosphate synthase TrpC [Flammeovirga kamogawensis]|uniref:Indole-3-glycerol phosphate synthase n=1 Tax=Flammeovirga kamogawensis TaxID=373891 RepID=A0ABX8GQS9_9BACT|nr:indole-3-glycerol phosphate synthase TrpC [Flammeovirga kamogawensis]MBB6462147.1 indole-3-glycerol phosphate synthase [Flammeovirga kamogawensis]QWG05881.1 indole-3-glycerol phosphate synthase TrpC [Flammeovirga kamogawensis]TRX67705.1 indole-3-glycerol phosphate synthase TrpC [Flammeovirga kamogawensis]